MVIDFHVHTFPAKIAAAALESMSQDSRTLYFTDGTMEALQASMQENGIDYSVNLPVMTSPKQVTKINSQMIDRREKLLSEGIIPFGGMHPLYEDYKTELKRLRASGIKGIKIHPAYQGPDLDDIHYMRIIEAASAEGLIVITHAGIDIGIYDHDYASVDAVLHILKEVAPEKFVLAHMGGWANWKQVESDLCGAPLWFDTAFSLGPVVARTDGKAPYLSENLNSEDFTRIVRKHGADKILFATDSPWARQGVYKDRVLATSLSAREKADILGDSAAALLGM